MRKKRVDEALKDSKFIQTIEEKFGENIIERDEDVASRDIKSISTGSISLDISTGVGGIPMGRFTEIFGPESSAKTSLCLSISKQAIEQGMNVLYVEPENSLDFKYIEAIVGTIDNKKFVLAQPETAEQALFICEAGVKSGQFNLIILDSVAALAPEDEKEDPYGKSHVAIIPRRMAEFLRRNAYAVRTSDIAFIFVNQIRDKIGTYYGGFDTPGGHAMKHFVAMRIQLSKSQDIEKVISTDKKEIVGIYSRFVIKKNKLAPPFRTFNFPLMFGKGIDTILDTLNFAELLGIVQKRGSYYNFEGENIGQGVAKTAEVLKNNKEMLDKITGMCYNVVSKSEIAPIPEESEAENEQNT